nr:putative ribonuclease H-like domain-containing protein [Tanacetum cinerariifolium]
MLAVVNSAKNGNSKKSLGRDSKGGIIILPHVSFEEHVVVQRETKAKTLLLQSLPKDHMADFHHLDDAREIWLAVKAKFGGNEESKKIRKTMLKQAFSEFSAKPDNDDVNIKFLRALPPSWSQVSLTLKTRGGLEYLSFDDLYNKLRSLEINVKGRSSYGSRSTTVASTHSVFIGAAKNKTEEAKQVYGLMAGFESDFVVPAGNAAGGVNPAAVEFAMMGNSPKVQTFPFGCDSKLSELKQNYDNLEKHYNDSFIQVQAYKNTVKTLEHPKDWYHTTQLTLEEKIRILSANLENTTNTLKYSETLYDQAKLEKKEWEVKTKLGLGFKEYIGSDEVCDISTPSVFDPEPDNREVKSLYERFVKTGKMHEVPPPIIGTFMPTSYQFDLAKTQATFGSKSNTSSILTSESNDFVFCDNSDKSSSSETYDFASCVSSPKTNDSFSTVDVKLLPKFDVKDPSLTNDLPSCSFRENVKPPRNLCNKSGTCDRIPCKNTFVRPKKCFVCGTSIHAGRYIPTTSRNGSASIPAGRSIPAASRNGPASIYAGRSIPAVTRNKPTSIHAGTHILAGRINKPAPFPDGRSVPTGWTNPAARPFFRPTNLYFDNLYWPRIYDHMSINEGRWGSAVKSSAGNKEKLDDFVQVKGASLEESTKWHRRMVHVNFKTINKLAKHGLVEGLPLNLFTNEHNCVAYNKGKQHKASYKAISAVRTISKPLQLLHMDLFGHTSIRSIDHEYYSLVVTDDFSREKGIKKDYSNARTPQQNEVAERKNRTLIEAARSMLADSKLPTMFWTEAVGTACYVLNRVFITNPHNKTPYELLSGKVPNIRHLKPFGCQVTILNTSDHLGKFEGKANDDFLVGYAAHSKAYRVYNLSSKKVEETLNLRYLENKPNVQGLGQEWYFKLDYLTDSLGYTCFKTNPPAGPTVHDVSALMENNLDYAEELARLQRQEYEAHSAAAKHGFEFSVDTATLLPQAEIEIRRNLVPAARDPAGSIVPSGGVPAGSVHASGVPAGGVLTGSSVPASGVPTGSIAASSIPAGGVLAGSIVSAEFGDPAASASVPVVFSTDLTATSPLPPGHSLGSCDHTARFPSPSSLENHQPTTGIFSSSSYGDDFCADVTNLASNIVMDHVATKRVDTIHPQSQIIGAPQSLVQTRSTVQKSKFGKSTFISYVHNQNRTNHVDHLHCLFACFLSQLEPSSVAKALEDPDWIAIGTKWILKNKRDARGIVVRNKARLVAQGHRQEEGIDYDEVFASVARIEAIHLFLAFASYMGFMVYQMDVKSVFLYGEIEEEVYVTQPKGFGDPHNPKHVYRVVKALYGLHQGPRA